MEDVHEDDAKGKLILSSFAEICTLNILCCLGSSELFNVFGEANATDESANATDVSFWNETGTNETELETGEWNSTETENATTEIQIETETVGATESQIGTGKTEIQTGTGKVEPTEMSTKESSGMESKAPSASSPVTGEKPPPPGLEVTTSSVPKSTSKKIDPEGSPPKSAPETSPSKKPDGDSSPLPKESKTNEGM